MRRGQSKKKNSRKTTLPRRSYPCRNASRAGKGRHSELVSESALKMPAIVTMTGFFRHSELEHFSVRFDSESALKIPAIVTVTCIFRHSEFDSESALKNVGDCFFAIVNMTCLFRHSEL
ncbi:MAG: hypothetical protein SOT81_10055 [Treponema sp.]|nr:hypothetical protein [Treponema sp.]